MIVQGSVRVPGDKSVSHRALILAALASGASRVRRVLQSADVHSTAGVLRTLGAAIPVLSADMVIEGRGPESLVAPGTELDCGNSGTTTRLMAGVVAARPVEGCFVGDASLSRRPMQRIAQPLSAMGAHIRFPNGDGLPMVVQGGTLTTVDWRSPVASAQVKSAILLAGTVSGVSVTVREPVRSRDHSERMLAAMGASVSVEGTVVHLTPPQRLAPLDLTVPGDPSSAAFMVALATLASGGELEIPDVCLNPTRTGFLDAVRDMGAHVRIEGESTQGGEATGTIVARPAVLHGISVGGDSIPAMIDELPLLACLATRASGTTTITGAAELRGKESDRIATVVANLRSIGADVEEYPDGMSVSGSDRPLRGQVRTRGDHRIAMAFGVLAGLPENRITLDDQACVTVSYPGFWTDLARVTASGQAAVHAL